MTTVNLTAVYYNIADDPTQRLVLPARSIEPSPGVFQQIRRYAGGRLRVINQAGRQYTIAVTHDSVERTDLRTLEAWTGLVVCYRDPMGRRLFVTWNSPKLGEIVGFDGADVDLTLTEVTWAE